MAVVTAPSARRPRLLVLPAVLPQSHVFILGTQRGAGRWLWSEHAGRAVARAGTCPRAWPGDSPASEGWHCVARSSACGSGSPRTHGDVCSAAFSHSCSRKTNSTVTAGVWLGTGQPGPMETCFSLCVSLVASWLRGGRVHLQHRSCGLVHCVPRGLRCPRLCPPLDVALQPGDAQGARGEHETAICPRCWDRTGSRRGAGACRPLPCALRLGEGEAQASHCLAGTVSRSCQGWS